ncbi:MAG TPA: hypothetical protein VLL76_08350, partial [Candidatus Omnitrophota bacterium]|nr:hypothetical protein [Candidatus Omnitrophota bacterium]
MSLRSIAHALFRHRRAMLAVMLVALTLGGFAAALHQPAWRAEATLLAESRRLDAARSLAALFESRDLHASVLRRLGDALYPALPEADRPAAFAGDLMVEPADGTALVRVAFDGPDPELAAQALAGLMDGVRARNASVFSVASGEAAVRDAKAAQDSLAAFRKRNNLFDPAAERDALLRRRAELEGQAVAAESEAAALADKLALLKTRLQTTPATISLQTESERTR